MKRALADIRIIDLTRVLAGPYCTMILADLGAEVIKIEVPERGDDSREFGPYLKGESAYFMNLNRNKKSITLNLKTEKGKEILGELIKKSDVLVENFRPGTLDKLGFSEKKINDLNYKMIYAVCSGYGQTGPEKNKACYDLIAQARSGLMSITGADENSPTKVGTSIADIVAGMFTAIGILSALYVCKRDKIGQNIDVAMLDSQVAILESALSRFLVTGKIPKPIGNRHPLIAPFEIFETLDDQIVIAVGNNALWKKFCVAIDRGDLSEDPRFETNQLRVENYNELRSYLVPIFKKKNTRDWLKIMDNEGIPCSPINNIADVIEDEQLKDRNMIVEILHPRAGKFKVINNPIKLSKTPGGIYKPSPILGENNEEILQKYLGYSKKEIKNLIEEGII